MLAQTEEDKEPIWAQAANMLQTLGSWSDRRSCEQFVCRRWWHQPPQVGGCWIYSNLCIAESPKPSWQPPHAVVPAFPPQGRAWGVQQPCPSPDTTQIQKAPWKCQPNHNQGRTDPNQPIPRGVYPTDPPKKSCSFPLKLKDRENWLLPWSSQQLPIPPLVVEAVLKLLRRCALLRRCILAAPFPIYISVTQQVQNTQVCISPLVCLSTELSAPSCSCTTCLDWN